MALFVVPVGRGAYIEGRFSKTTVSTIDYWSKVSPKVS